MSISWGSPPSPPPAAVKVILQNHMLGVLLGLYNIQFSKLSPEGLSEAFPQGSVRFSSILLESHSSFRRLLVLFIWVRVEDFLLTWYIVHVYITYYIIQIETV